MRGAPPLLPRRRAPRWAELVVGWALLLTAAAAVAFIVVYVYGADTQWLGLSLGLGFAFMAAASIVGAKQLVPQERREQEREPLDHEKDDLDIAVYVQEAGQGITRTKLLKRAGGVAGVAFVGAIVAPLASCGAFLDVEELRATVWRRGVRLVDDAGRSLTAADIAIGSMTPAFAEGADREHLDSSLIVVRLKPGDVQLPGKRSDWAPDGILAFSKICTHAGCAVSMFRYPLYAPRVPGPALVCPCHYSTFDPATGGTVLFGPAGRPLPQLPLAIDDKGHLRAAGEMSSPVGPSWWGVRQA